MARVLSLPTVPVCCSPRNPAETAGAEVESTLLGGAGGGGGQCSMLSCYTGVSSIKIVPPPTTVAGLLFSWGNTLERSYGTLLSTAVASLLKFTV